MEQCQGEIIQKPKMQELSSLFMTHRLNVMHALVKFHEYIPYGLGVMARTRSGTYGRMEGQTDGPTDVRTGLTGVTLNALPLFFECGGIISMTEKCFSGVKAIGTGIFDQFGLLIH